jgi:DNA-binding response OmpR family regulator
VRKTKNQRGQNEIDQNRSRAEQASQVQRLVTRAQIAQTLWGPDAFVDVEQGIKTAIRKIRIALEDDSAQPRFLQTVVGRGYRWVTPLC